MAGSRLFRIALVSVAALAAAGANVTDAFAQSTSGLPLPPGQVLTGTVYKAPFSCPPNFISSITNGADANTYILPASCSAVPSFVASDPAAMVVTSAPTQYVRFFGNGSVANRPFMADPSTVRGLSPAQIQDVLALPTVPTMETIVLVPAGTCVLVAIGAPAFGGSGGPAQEWAAGTPSGANCSGLQFLPLSDYINQQPIGDAALLYGPRGGGGNTGAVAAALDRGPYPAPFTSMESLYDGLDLLNYGDPAPLRAALAQLDGEVYSSARTVILEDSLYVRDALLARMRQAAFAGSIGPLAALASGGPLASDSSDTDVSDPRLGSDSVLAYTERGEPPFSVKAAPVTLPSAASPTVFWGQDIGAWGRLEGTGDAADVHRDLGGFLLGADRSVAPNWLAGVAAGYTNTSLTVADPASSATIETGYLADYATFGFGRFNLRGAGAASISTIDADRSIAFATFADAEGARYRAATAQVFGELGYGMAFGRLAAEPFAGLAFVYLRSNNFAESGSNGIAALSGAAGNDGVGFTTLGLRVATDDRLTDNMMLIPHASAAWQHVVGQLAPTTALAFQMNGASFTAAGVPLARDAALVQAGFDLHLGRRMTLGLSYVGSLAERVQDNAVRGNLTWRF